MARRKKRRSLGGMSRKTAGIGRCVKRALSVYKYTLKGSDPLTPKQAKELLVLDLKKCAGKL